jgi:hypothetical protein
MITNSRFKIFISGVSLQLAKGVEKYLHLYFQELAKKDKTIKLLQCIPGNGGTMGTHPFKLGDHFIICNEGETFVWGSSSRMNARRTAIMSLRLMPERSKPRTSYLSTRSAPLEDDGGERSNCR